MIIQNRLKSSKHQSSSLIQNKKNDIIDSCTTIKKEVVRKLSPSGGGLSDRDKQIAFNQAFFIILGVIMVYFLVCKGFQLCF